MKQEELWSLDYTIAEFALPRLKAFRARLNGWPCGMTMEEWESILDKMIQSMELLLDDEYIEHEGFELFGKHFTSLWS